jgi:flagellar biosynthesis/type III secretory pathway M-ring protein FliF/YscJ
MRFSEILANATPADVMGQVGSGATFSGGVLLAQTNMLGWFVAGVGLLTSFLSYQLSLRKLAAEERIQERSAQERAQQRDHDRLTRERDDSRQELAAVETEKAALQGRIEELHRQHLADLADLRRLHDTLPCLACPPEPKSASDRDTGEHHQQVS